MGPVHVEALRRLGLPVRGIMGSTPEKSAAAAGALNLPRGYRNYQELLDDPDVDAVHVTTPNKLHHPMVSAAFDAGKHVMCEKPLAMTSAESADLVARAKASGLHGGVNYNIRFYPLCQEAARRTIGNVFSITGSYVQDWLLYSSDYNWRVLESEGGELRAVADMGTHWLDLVTFISGLRLERVFAYLKTVHPTRNRPIGEVETFKSALDQDVHRIEIKTEDQGAILLNFKGGATGVLWVSQATAGRKNRLQFEIAGADGAMAWDSENANELWLGRRAGPNEILLKDPSLLSADAARYAAYPGGHLEGYPDSFKQCFGAFYRGIEGESPVQYPTFADGHREILFCEAVLASHREGRWANIKESP
jgi:predicted dehydrogenase